MQNLLRITLITLTAASMLPCGMAQQAPSAPPTKAPAATPQKSQQSAAPKSPQTAAKTKAPFTLKTPKDKASYAMGMNIGNGLRKQSVDIDPAILARGLKDAFSNGKTLLTEEEVRTILTQLQADMRKKQQEVAQVAAENNKKQGID